MAVIRGSNVPTAFAWAYDLAISRWTTPRLSRLRTRVVGAKFASFGPGSSISFGCRILEPSRINVGARTTIPNTSVIDGRGGLDIGDDCLIGFENVILTSTHESASTEVPIRDQGMYQRRVTIGDDVWTGCRVVIVPGVTIGSHVIIGAGSVVINDVPEWAVCGGVPARVLRDRRSKD
jgi:acetyltransferase-like isoleucine patch superfamily enzyme